MNTVIHQKKKYEHSRNIEYDIHSLPKKKNDSTQGCRIN